MRVMAVIMMVVGCDVVMLIVLMVMQITMICWSWRW